MIRFRFSLCLLCAGVLSAAPASWGQTAPAYPQTDQYAALPTASNITTTPGQANPNGMPTPSPALTTVPQTSLFPSVTDYGNPEGPQTSSILNEERDAQNRGLKEIMRPPVPVVFTPYSSQNPYANENPYPNQVVGDGAASASATAATSGNLRATGTAAAANASQVGLPTVDLNASQRSAQVPVIAGPNGLGQLPSGAITTYGPGSQAPVYGQNPYAGQGVVRGAGGLPGITSQNGVGMPASYGGATPPGTAQLSQGFSGNGVNSGGSIPADYNAALAAALQALRNTGAAGGSRSAADRAPASGWQALPPAGASAALKNVAKESIVPPFTISAASRSLDLSRIWWSPELLSIRIGRPAGGGEGVVVPWRRSPAGFPAAILIARLPTIENRQIIIKQAVSMMWVDNSWIAEGSSMAVVLREKNGDMKTLITPADGQGMWRIRLTKGDTVEVWRWIGTALNGCRAPLAEELNNEELRQLLINSGEVVWRISPAPGTSKT